MRSLKTLALGGVAVLATLATPAVAQVAPPEQGEELMSPAMLPVMPMREQAQLRDKWLVERFDSVLAPLMRENGIDMWILVAREYLEDPVMTTMLNATNLRARRRTILVFFDPGQGKPLERIVVSKHGMGDLYTHMWNMDTHPNQWHRLREIVAERNPKKIAVNTSSLSAFGDGMTHTQYTELLSEGLTPALRKRVVPGYPLAIGWLETRTPGEMVQYEKAVRMAHSIMGEGFSTRVIEIGKTTNEDLVWWYRQRVQDLGLASWFQPSVTITRRGVPGTVKGESVIQRGDMLHLDFGITYLGLNTDTQHLAYVLREGETDAPAGLKAGMLANNRVQDAVTSEFKVGRTGNEVLRASRAKAIAAGLRPNIYSHPIGYHGHAAGSTVGLSEEQNFVPTGEYKLRANAAWSIELSATHNVPEWDNQEVRFPSEEDMFFDGKTVKYIDGRQTKFHLIGY